MSSTDFDMGYHDKFIYKDKLSLNVRLLFPVKWTYKRVYYLIVSVFEERLLCLTGSIATATPTPLSSTPRPFTTTAYTTTTPGPPTPPPQSLICPDTSPFFIINSANVYGTEQPACPTQHVDNQACYHGNVTESLNQGCRAASGACQITMATPTNTSCTEPSHYYVLVQYKCNTGKYGSRRE